jgi:hypothetical protein
MASTPPESAPNGPPPGAKDDAGHGVGGPPCQLCGGAKTIRGGGVTCPACQGTGLAASVAAASAGRSIRLSQMPRT